MKPDDVQIIEWSSQLAIGIKVIDLQHRTLLRMTNDLFTGCLYGSKIADQYFQSTVHQTVDYIRRHFITEERLMEAIAYPQLAEHRRQHGAFIKELLVHVRKFEAGDQLIPNHFARYLRDWILSHIAIMDKKYGDYYKRQSAAGSIPFFINFEETAS
jgi:hemerythrin